VFVFTNAGSKWSPHLIKAGSKRSPHPIKADSTLHFEAFSVKVEPDRLQVRSARMFKRVGELQNALLSKCGAVNLQPHRQSFGGLAAGD